MMILAKKINSELDLEPLTVSFCCLTCCFLFLLTLSGRSIQEYLTKLLEQERDTHANKLIHRDMKTNIQIDIQDDRKGRHTDRYGSMLRQNNLASCYVHCTRFLGLCSQELIPFAILFCQIFADGLVHCVASIYQAQWMLRSGFSYLWPIRLIIIILFGNEEYL